MSSLVFIIGTQFNRAGAHEDIPTIKETFEKLFDSEVHLWIDLNNANELKVKLTELKTSEIWLNKFYEAQFVAIFCMAHGWTDGMVQLFKSSEIEDVQKALLNPFFKIKELDKKLKWLVVQSCRGGLNDLDLQTDGKRKQKLYLDHYYVSYCTEEGTISYQENPNGKIFLQKLCAELQNNAKIETLDKMLTNVSAEVQRFADEHNYENYSIPNFVKNSPIEYKFFE